MFYRYNSPENLLDNSHKCVLHGRQKKRTKLGKIYRIKIDLSGQILKHLPWDQVISLPKHMHINTYINHFLSFVVRREGGREGGREEQNMKKEVREKKKEYTVLGG